MKVKITIDGHRLEVERGITILKAAQQNQIYIPTLCDHPDLTPHGSCRLCLVEIQGSPKTPTACTTLVEEGMIIRTNTAQIQTLRTELLQMLLTVHPTSCLFCSERDNCDECMVTLRKSGITTGCRSCPKDHQCEIQNMVARLGLTAVHYPVSYRMLKIEKDNPFFDCDYNLCVYCGRCVRICEHLHFAGTLAYTHRGSEVLVGTAFGRGHLEAGCSFCGACVEVCPTGVLTEKTRKWDGIPDQETLTTCPLCSIGCQMRILSKEIRSGGSVVIGSLPEFSAANGSLCVKGRFGVPELVNHPSRLKQPQKLVGNNRLSLPWSEAIQLAAEKLAACPPEKFKMLIAPDCSNEDLYVAQKFTRSVMKSPNISSTAAEAYGSGLNAALNLLKNSHSLVDLEDAAAILCLGLDGKYAQSVTEIAIHQAKKKGVRLVSIYPGRHSLSDYADEWLEPSPGEEAKLLRQLVRLTREQMSEEIAEPVSSLSEGLERTAKMLLGTSKAVILVGPTFLEHPDNQLILEAIEHLAKNTGARLIVLPAQGNLVGSFLMGAYPEILPGGFPAADPERRARVGKRWGMVVPAFIPDRTNPSTASPDVQVLYLIGEVNPADCPSHEFLIYQNIYPPQPTGEADLIMPAAAFTEADGTYVNYEGRLRKNNQAVSPPGEALPSWQILCRIAQAMGVPGFKFTSIEDIHDEIAGFVGDFRINSLVNRWPLSPVFSERPGATQFTRHAAHTYLGFPLTIWVEGLRTLYPEETGGG